MKQDSIMLIEQDQWNR